MGWSACLIVLTGGTLLAACGASTGPASPCGAEPLQTLNVFLEDSSGAPPSAILSGRVKSISEVDASGFVHVIVEQDAGGERSIALRSPVLPLPFETGRHYEFLLEYAGGSPPACGIAVDDSNGLVMAGASDQALGAHVLRGNALSGWTLALAESGCPSRSPGGCYRSITSRTLTVRHGERTLSLYSAQAETLGAYRVVCLAAQRVEYDPRCTDAGLIAVSWSILRTDGGAEDQAPMPRGE